MTWIKNSKAKKILFPFLLVATVFLIYANSVDNEYALDDNVVIERLAYFEGSDHLASIFTHHHVSDEHQKYGYRPLVLLTFSLERKLFKSLPAKQTVKEKRIKNKVTQANVSHFVNLLFYALTALVLFYFLRYLFVGLDHTFSFLITLLFVVHPLHTEVVDNLKSRDELLMFLGSIAALLYYVKYARHLKAKHLMLATLFFFMAVLSKKTAIGLLGVLPIVLYFDKARAKPFVASVLSLILAVAAFVLLKKSLLTDVSVRNLEFFENPLVSEGGIWDRFSLGLYCAWHYLKMLIYPHELSFYYGYSKIPMADWSYYEVWLALTLYLFLLVYGFVLLIKRNALGLGLILWLGLMFAYLNILSPVAGIVADRFPYFFSLGFCIAFVALLSQFFKVHFEAGKSVKLPTTYGVMLLAVLALYSVRVINRNPDWENYLVLYQSDIDHLEESAKANTLLANELYMNAGREEDKVKAASHIKQAYTHYKKALEVYPSYVEVYNNLGSLQYEFLRDFKSAKQNFLKAYVLDSAFSQNNIYNIGSCYGQLGQLDSSLFYYKKLINQSEKNKALVGMAKKVYVSYAQLLLKENLVDSAKQVYHSAIQNYPNDPRFFCRACKHFSGTGRYSKRH